MDPSVCLFISRSSFPSYLPFTILIRKFPSEAPVNFFNRILIRGAIREAQGFGLICNLRRPARGGEWRFCRSVRRIERPAKSNKRERRRHGGNAAVNDVTSDSAICFYVVSSSLILLRDFSAKVAKNLWEIRKRSLLIAPSLSSYRPLSVFIRKSPSDVLEHQKYRREVQLFHGWLRVTEARRVIRFPHQPDFSRARCIKAVRGCQQHFLDSPRVRSFSAKGGISMETWGIAPGIRIGV